MRDIFALHYFTSYIFTVRFSVHGMSEPIVHGDVKAVSCSIKVVGSGFLHRIVQENILVARDDLEAHILLCDFGCSRVYDNIHGLTSNSAGDGGTICFMANDVLEEGKVTPAGDMFAFGTFLCQVRV